MIRPFFMLSLLLLIQLTCSSESGRCKQTPEYKDQFGKLNPSLIPIPEWYPYIPEDIQGTWINLADRGQHTIHIEPHRIKGVPIGKVVDNGTVTLDYEFCIDHRRAYRFGSPADVFIVDRIHQDTILITEVYLVEWTYRYQDAPPKKKIEKSCNYYLCTRDTLEAKQALQEECPRLLNPALNMDFVVTERRLKNKNPCIYCVGGPQTVVDEIAKGKNIEFQENYENYSWSLSMKTLNSQRIDLTLQMTCDMSFQFPNSKPGDIFIVGHLKIIETLKNGTKIESEPQLNCFLKRRFLSGGMLLVQGKLPDCTVIIANEQIRLSPQNGLRMFYFYNAF